MSAPDSDPSEELDRRDLVAVPYWDVVREIDRRAAEIELHARGRALPTDVVEQLALGRYAQEVLLFGNCGGRGNRTITLPQPWRVADIIAVTGCPDDAEPGSDAAWRAVRKRYDASQGLVRDAGRTRA